MTRTVRSIKLGNHLTGFITLQTMFMQKNQEPTFVFHCTHTGSLGNPRNDGLWGREWEIRWVSNILPFNKKNLSQNQSYSNEISSMVLQLNLEHYEFSSSNLDLEKISYLKKKKKRTGGLSLARTTRTGGLHKQGCC